VLLGLLATPVIEPMYLAKDALEIAAINSGNDYFNRHAYEDVETHNETIYQKNTNNFAKRIEHVVQQCERVAKAVSGNLIVGNYPIVLSGDHSSALGTISGLKSANPHARIGVIWLDAHTDIHSPFTSPSGNIHGMPLAAALGLDNLQYQINQPDEATLLQWYKMKNIGIDGPKILPQDLIYFGIRDYEEAEEKVINDQKIKFFKVEELRFKGLENCVQEAIQLLSNCDLIYISFDVDSMDCDRISYGTGTPVPAGFNPEEVIQIIQLFQATGKVKCIELTEINPLLDNKGNKMAETAFEVLDKVSNTI
jgi:arginase